MDTTQQSPAAQASGSSWTSFVKSIASFNGDLSSLTAPPFIVSAKSLTEFSSYWAEHPALFSAPAHEPDPEKRAVLVLKWFLACLKQHYASRSEQYGNEKKPLNPFLGELFLGTWEDDVASPEAPQGSGTTELVSEQVSHHPPATAYSITNVPTGVHLEGYNAQKASFKSTIIIKQIGHAVLTVPVPAGADGKEAEPDKYLITLPGLHIEGLLFGSPFVELDGCSYITSSTGYTARIDYSGKGWLSGKKNSVTAVLYPTGREKEVLYNASGQWTKAFTIHKGPAKTNSSSTLVATYEPAQSPTLALNVQPIEKQHPLESRRAWRNVADAVAKGDLDTLSFEKTKIENAQREMRALEKAEGRTWERRYFSAVPEGESDPVLASLASHVGLTANGDSDKTGGLWRFDRTKAEAAKKTPPLTEAEAAKIAQEYLGQRD
ncbi:Oxysterol-binding protein 4 [Sporothrix curviconia]|uniref:Oxysterol-binding protein 4 n=1 Tax=Sporothrix curviconia TaxID=1260050 RepID=A0ABP0AT84_9PEZI